MEYIDDLITLTRKRESKIRAIRRYLEHPQARKLWAHSEHRSKLIDAVNRCDVYAVRYLLRTYGVDSLQEMSLTQLRKLAATKGITYVCRYTRHELITLIKQVNPNA